MKTRVNPFLISVFIFLQAIIAFSQSQKTESVSNKYHFSFSFMGGESIFTNEFLTWETDSYSKAQPNLNLSATYYLSDVKAVKIDAGYTYTKSYTGSYMVDESFYEDATRFISFKGNFLVGKFEPGERLMYNLSIGLGVHIWKGGTVTDVFSENSGFGSRSYIYIPETEVSGLVSLGGSIGYIIFNGIGVRAEAEYDMLTGKQRNYFPIRAGIFYIF